MHDLRRQIIEEHIKNNYPNASIIEDNATDSDLKFYDDEHLKYAARNWFPVSCRKDPETGRVVYGGRTGIYHTYTIGETGAGKTTRFVMQSIRALSQTNNKPSFVITDMHGEIIETLYKHLNGLGYRIRILNCDDPSRPDTYNPLSGIASQCLAEKKIGNDAINKIRMISEIMQPVQSQTDPVWDTGARSYTNGCILDKAEDLIRGNMPAECMTVYNVIQNHYRLRQQLQDKYRGDGIFSIPHYKRKGPDALSVQKMISVTDNADKTRSSYFGVVENHFDAFGQPSLYALSSSCTIDISEFIEEPTALVIQTGCTQIADHLIALFMNDLFTHVVKLGKASRSKMLPRNVHCFLDEFANCNIADGPTFNKMLTTSRKFGMFWHLILQSDAQLDRKYDRETSRIIRSNCTEIFLGTNDYETSVRFAESCGKKTIESIGSVIMQQAPVLETVNLMTPDKLNRMPEGYVYIRSNRFKLTYSYIEALYNCAEYDPEEDIDKVYPHNNFDYTTTQFCTGDIPPALTERQIDILKAAENGISYKELCDKFGSDGAGGLVEEMEKKGVIKLHTDCRVESLVTPMQMRLYETRKEYGLFFAEAPVEKKRPRPNFRCLDDDDFEDDEEDEPEEPEEDVNLICASLENYYSNKPHVVLSKVDGMTMAPQWLKDAIHKLCETGTCMEHSEDFPHTLRTLSFCFLEELVINNDFDDKRDWLLKATGEYDDAVSSGAFTEDILKEFAEVVKQIDENLTLANIREIKKIVNG